MRYATTVGLVLFLCAAMAPVATAVKPSLYTLADSMTFRDAPATPGVAGSGDAIYSDGSGPYLNGALGVTMQIFTGGTGDLTFGVGTTRVVWTSTTNDRLAPIQQVTGAHPNAPIPCGNGGNVSNIWGIPIGATQQRTLALGCNGLSSSDLLEFGPAGNSGTAGQYSFQVNVTRLSKTEWVVTSDGSPDEAVYQTQVSAHPARTAWTAQYILPFSLDVKCSLCQNVN